MKAHYLMTMSLTLLIAAGCHGTTSQAKKAPSPDPVVGMLHQGVIELNGNIDELTRHIAHLQQMPTAADSRVQELQGLDLAGWQLHLQQWVLQRDHLSSSLSLIQRVQANPGQKTSIGGQWSDRQAQFVKTMEELTSHRQKLEHKRLEVESQVLGQYFK